MLSIFKTSQRSSFLSELLLTLLFGGFSLLLALLYNADQGVADFRESPLLILLFYLKNPFLIPLSCFITSFGYGSYSTTFVIHMVGLVPAWFFVQWLKKQSFSRSKRGLLWMSFIVVYYGVFLLPTWIIYKAWILDMMLLSEANMAAMGLTKDSSFFEYYLALFDSAKYEVITTMTVTSLYLMELEARRILVSNNHTLEGLVKERTEELDMANSNLRKLNKQLIEKNNEIKLINVNLDEVARKRAEKIQSQMQALSQYAQVNSHEVRAPLARILSICKQLEFVLDEDVKQDLISNIHISANELDVVIRKINKILTE